MAGSLKHIVDSKTGKFRMGSIENMGDAHEALHECFELIRLMSHGDANFINSYCRQLGFPEVDADLVESDLDRSGN